MARDVSPWPITSYGWAPADMKYRWDWITPLAISPHDHNRVYVGAQVVFMTTDGGQSWKRDQPRSHDEHEVAPAELRRHHVRQPHDVRRRHAVRDRRVAGEGRRDLDGQRRRSGERHAGRRRALDERDEEHSEPAAVGHGVERRAVDVRRGDARTSS